MILDAWAQASNILFESERYGSVARVPYRGRKLYLLKPSTYLNLSGNAVRYWMQKLKLPQQNLIVICDDLNLPFGMVRMRRQGSDGGHNGLKNIRDCLGTEQFARVRIGIGNQFRPGRVESGAGTADCIDRPPDPGRNSDLLHGGSRYGDEFTEF